MRLRRATMDDALDVLAWRNDPLTIAMSKTPGSVDQQSHMAWFARAISGEARVILIALEGERKLGMVRFDAEDRGWVISINLAPSVRGRGLSAEILQQALTSFRATHGTHKLVAEIKEDNAPSIRLFEQCGFKKLDQSNGFWFYVLSA